MSDADYQVIIKTYSDNVDHLVRKYASYDRSIIFPHLNPILPSKGGRILEVGSGSGIDAFKFASDGYYVTAVEPSDLMNVAQRDYAHPNIRWVKDSLPDLAQLSEQDKDFDLVFLNRVFMHVLPKDQSKALNRLIALTASKGSLFMIIRHGPSFDPRPMYPVDLSMLEKSTLAAAGKYRLCEIVPDYEGRQDVSWSIVHITH